MYHQETAKQILHLVSVSLWKVYDRQWLTAVAVEIPSTEEEFVHV
jgi:hypothetical protein